MSRTLFKWFLSNIQRRQVKIYITYACFTNSSPSTNLIIKSTFVVGFYPSTLFLVFQVSVKGWKGNFSFKSQKSVFKKKKQKWPFFQFLFLILLFHLCRPIIFSINKFVSEFHWLFQKIKEIITNFVFFGNFVLKIFAHSIKVRLKAFS